MFELVKLKVIAQAACDEAEGDWFDPALLDSAEPIRSSRKARAHIAAFSPAVALALIAVAEAAKAVAWYDWTPFDSDCDGDMTALRAALDQLEQA